MNNPTTATPGTSSDRFLWWLATAEPELIETCKVDRNRYRIIGLSIFCTWLFATVAWSYFFYTTTSNYFIAITAGVVMGFIILCIDRALIKGISGQRNAIGGLVLRLGLALCIGLFMAQPALLYLFDSEIKLQASLDDEQRRIAKSKELDSLYAPQKQEWLAKQKLAIEQRDKRYAEVQQARQAYVQETDGSGGSGKIGISNIALAKKAEMEKLERDYLAAQTQLDAPVKQADSALAALADTINVRQASFGKLLNNGFLTRIEALHHLIDKNSAVATRYYLIVVLLMLIELMPLLSKLLMPTGSYEEQVLLTEQNEKQLMRYALRKEQTNIEQMLDRQYAINESLAESVLNETSIIRKQEADAEMRAWQTTRNEPFARWWKALARRIFYNVNS